VVASAFDSVVVSASLVDDFEDSVECGKDPGSSGAIDPRDSVSVGCADMDMLAALSGSVADDRVCKPES
jgi:hypothetical protein